jgi:hypothetical protein
MGCGDFTIDTLEGMNKLVSKESTIKDFTIGNNILKESDSFNLTCSFYRFNSKKNKLINNQNQPLDEC